ncbi:MAG: hypothetical protein R2731_15485 [Nocardioides sp.]
METSYVSGEGVLLARGRRWLLVDDDPGEEQLGAWWQLLGTAGPIQGALEEALEQADPLKERSLVCVDLDDPAASLTWNKGRVEWDGEAQLLTVGLTDEGRARPFVAGVVAAASARIGPAAASGGLIDGIPDDILASTASGPSPSRPVFQEATQLPADDEEVAVTMPRLQPVTASPPVEPGAPGVYRSEMSDHLRQSTQETVLAVHCPAGHVTPAYTPTCRVCHTTVPPQEPRRIPRPNLGSSDCPPASGCRSTAG